jgi:putative transcriptional regulator
MATKTKKTPARKSNGRLTRELLETARDMRASGLLTKAAHEKITMRHMENAAPTIPVTLGQK